MQASNSFSKGVIRNGSLTYRISKFFIYTLKWTYDTIKKVCMGHKYRRKESMGKFKTWLQKKWEMQVLNMITKKWGIINPFPYPHEIWSNFWIQGNGCIWAGVFLFSDVFLIPIFHSHAYRGHC